MSRTAQFATVTIVDNVVRAMPLLVSEAERLKTSSREELQGLLDAYDNARVLSEALRTMERRLRILSKKGAFIRPRGEQ
jgi:4-phosphopantoate--beta-alanine ligase